MRSRALLAPAALVALVFALTGCQPGLLAPDGDDAPTAEPTETPAPTTLPVEEDPAASPDSEGEPSEAPSQEPISGDDAIGFTCEQVLTLDQLYDFDQNFTPADEAGRDLPSVFQSIGDEDGIVCAYRHVTAEAVLLVGVAGGSSSVVTGYTNEVGIGTTAAAAGEYIVAVGSTYFGSAGDADSLVQQVSGNLQ